MNPIEQNRTGKRPLLWVALLLVLGLAAYTVYSMTRTTLGVRVAKASRADLVSLLPTNGKVEPVEEFQAHAAAPGVVKRLYVGVGDRVSKGTLLVQMDDSDARARMATANAALKTAQVGVQDVRQGGSQEELITLSGDLKRAQLQHQQAAKDLASLEELQSRGTASASEVAAARQRAQTTESALQSLQARSTGRYSAADRARAQAQLAEAEASRAAAHFGYAGADIRSPIAGVVYHIPVNEYDFVPAGEDLMDVADLSKLQVRAYFDEPEIGKLAVGQSVNIVWDARPTESWHGHVSRAPTTVITYGTRNVGECFITIDDPRGTLLPHTNVTVTVTTSQLLNVVSVPREALRTDAANRFVYRVIAGHLKKTTVQVGAVNLTRVEILSGLSADEVVALNATSNQDLSDGMKVNTVQ